MHACAFRTSLQEAGKLVFGWLILIIRGAGLGCATWFQSLTTLEQEPTCMTTHSPVAWVPGVHYMCSRELVLVLKQPFSARLTAPRECLVTVPSLIVTSHTVSKIDAIKVPACDMHAGMKVGEARWYCVTHLVSRIMINGYKMLGTE
jgi:hypothetical protein